MADLRNAVVVGGNRVPFGKIGGAYASATNIDLLTAAIDGLVARFGLAGERLGEVGAGAVLDSFIAGIDACKDPAAKQTLEELCTLFALTSLEADMGWFVAHNRMSDTRAKALRKQINQVCGELRPRATALVEGFGIPVEWLGSEMLEG